jgi:hypothetical protein
MIGRGRQQRVLQLFASLERQQAAWQRTSGRAGDSGQPLTVHDAAPRAPPLISQSPAVTRSPKRSRLGGHHMRPKENAGPAVRPRQPS